jgi:hypothetical protein
VSVDMNAISAKHSENKFSIIGDFEELVTMLQFCLIGINRNPIQCEEFSRLHEKVVKILDSVGRIKNIGVLGF